MMQSTNVNEMHCHGYHSKEVDQWCARIKNWRQLSKHQDVSESLKHRYAERLYSAHQEIVGIVSSLKTLKGLHVAHYFLEEYV